VTVTRPLLHLVDPSTWAAVVPHGELRPESLDAVGFTHLSTPDQVEIPANCLYADAADLLVLVVDPRLLTDEVRFEAGVPPEGDLRFPHLYGPLPAEAVVAALPMERDAGADGAPRWRCPPLPRLDGHGRGAPGCRPV
jgi:uncharacterized protein (DUF952 family)